MSPPYNIAERLLCFNQFKKDVKKLDFAEITCKLLIGISEHDFEEFLGYARVDKVVDARDER